MGGQAITKVHVVTWVTLIVAGLLEVVWAFSMKQSEGFTKLWPSLATIVAMLLSFVLLAWAMRTLPLGTAYPVWTGIGAIGAFVVGLVFLGEAASVARIMAAALIVSGLVLMNASNGARSESSRIENGSVDQADKVKSNFSKQNRQ